MPSFNKKAEMNAWTGILRYCAHALFCCGISIFAAQPIQLSTPLAPASEPTPFGLQELPMTSPHPDLVAFSSYSSALVENDTNDLPDIFVWSRASGHVKLLTVATNGDPANGASCDPALSKDGRFVAFVSSASNFFTDTNHVEDVFIANVETGQIELVSVPARTGAGQISSTRNTVISEDGRFVAYTTSRTDLSPTPSPSVEHVLVRDRQNGQTLWPSYSFEGISRTFRPVAIAQSKLWFFYSTNLYRFNLTNQELLAVGPSTVNPAFSPDGTKVVLQVATLQTNAVTLFDSTTSLSRLIFADTTKGATNYDSPSISDNGTVAFMAVAANDPDRISNIFTVSAADQISPPTLVSSIPTPSGSTAAASSPLVTPDGKHVYFKWNVVSKSDATRRSEIYIKNLPTDAPTLVAGGSYFSRMIATPTGPLVLCGAGDLSFTTSSSETDLVLLAYPPEAPSVRLQLARAGNAWKISYPNIPEKIGQVQFSETLLDWADLPGTPDVTADGFSVSDPETAPQRFYRLRITP